MSKNFEIQELAIVIIAKNLNPTVLTPDFLKYTGVVPADWELAKQPVYTNGVVQIFFTNGLGIVAQPNSVTLLESIGTKPAGEVLVPKITQNLINKLSQVEYQTVGINPRGFTTFNSEDDAYQYISGKLLAPGSWQQFGEGKVNATLQLTYPLKRGTLNLGINQVNVQFPDKQAAAILFSGNFNYPLAGDTPAERIQDLQQIVNNWQDSLNTYQQLLVEKFLPSSEAPRSLSVFPPMAKS
ncbi:hypothetical protein [Anabaena catenula]|uniref:Uncharacterized protein n=1 Tax=Anabaena catenula FACHB-362 TaxID=2692877 RepID=A0ABR8J800_9NOST|nr:hypothetical protein [Anabaena catenula]MBD2693710.1 hypothetical protein [Anabaena catenula FACHB-362]